MSDYMTDLLIDTNHTHKSQHTGTCTKVKAVKAVRESRIL